MSDETLQGTFWCVCVRVAEAGDGEEGGEREGGKSSTGEGCEKNTQAHTPAIQINFKAEVEEIAVPTSPRFLVWRRTSIQK